MPKIGGQAHGNRMRLPDCDACSFLRRLGLCIVPDRTIGNTVPCKLGRAHFATAHEIKCGLRSINTALITSDCARRLAEKLADGLEASLPGAAVAIKTEPGSEE